MMTFKEFMENLWGEIPVTTRKPSDGQPHASKMSMSSNQGGGGGGAGPAQAVGNPFAKAMMKKKMEKK